MIRGIGPAYAEKLLRAFGEKVFDVIEATPDRLREVDGIGPVRAASILAAWAEQKAVREIMVFLHSHGVGTARAVRIYKTYGPDAIQVMTENPYRLARDIRDCSDPFAAGFGLATRNQSSATPWRDPISRKRNPPLLLDIARRARPLTPSEFAKKKSMSGRQAAAPGLPGRRRSN